MKLTPEKLVRSVAYPHKVGPFLSPRPFGVNSSARAKQRDQHRRNLDFFETDYQPFQIATFVPWGEVERCDLPLGAIHQSCRKLLAPLNYLWDDTYPVQNR